MVRGLASHLSCHPELQEDLTPRAQLMQVRILGNAESLASHQVGQQKLGFRRSHVSFRICASGRLPFLFVATPAILLALRVLHEKH
jgi:hypothetical protein